MKRAGRLPLEMNESIEDYRQYFRQNEIPALYNGWAHIAISGGLLTGTLFFAADKIGPMNLPTVLAFLATLLLSNFVVWWLHRYPLHRRFKFFPYAYDVHTKCHHRFFTKSHVTFEGGRDFYIIFFPIEVVAGFVALMCPITWIGVNALMGANMAWTFVTAASAYFLLYELMHFTCHLDEQNPLLKVPFLKKMWHHHRLHHDPQLMGQYNFNIVFPLFDILTGTIYRKDEGEEIIARENILSRGQ